MNPIIFALSTGLILCIIFLLAVAAKAHRLQRNLDVIERNNDLMFVEVRDLRVANASLRKQVQIDLAQQPAGYEVERWTLPGPGETPLRLVYRNLFKEPETAESVAKSLDFENSKHPGTVTIAPLFKR